MDDTVNDITLRYGNVNIRAAKCPACGVESFVEPGALGGDVSACCGEAIEPVAGPNRVRVVAGAGSKRKKPPLSVRLAVLESQDNRCLYCRNHFGTAVEVKGIMRHLIAVWDHFVPFSYSADNGGRNFVAACQLCNGLKSNRVFEHQEDATAFILRGWERKGYRVL